MELNLFEPSLLLVSDSLFFKNVKQIKTIFSLYSLIRRNNTNYQILKINPAPFVKMVKIRRGNNVETGPVSS